MIRYKTVVLEGKSWKRHDHCNLSVSVGSDLHEGAKFDSTIQWINKRFKTAHIYLCDTLHRHDYVFEYCEDIEAAYNRARLEGDHWLVRNSDSLGKLTIPYNLSRWDRWLENSHYFDFHQTINYLFEHNFEFRNAVHADADRYLSSAKKQGKIQHESNFVKSKCIDFLLEEISVFPLIHETYPGAEIYPGSELQATRLIRKKLIQGAPECFYNKGFTRIGFKRLKSSIIPSRESIFGVRQDVLPKRLVNA